MIRRLIHWTLGLVVAGVLVVVPFVFYTETGARWALRAALPLLPANLSVGEVRGSLSDTLRLRDVRASDDGLLAEADGIQLTIDWRGLSQRQLRVRALNIDTLRLRLPSGSAGSAPGDLAWLEQGLAEHLPGDLVLSQVQLHKLCINDTPCIDGLTLRGLLRSDGLALAQANALLPGEAWFEGSGIAGQAPLSTWLAGRLAQQPELRAGAQLSANSSHGQMDISARLQGNPRQLDLDMKTQGALTASLEARLRDWTDTPQGEVTAIVQAGSPSPWLPETVTGPLTLQAEGHREALSITAQATFADQPWRAEIAELSLTDWPLLQIQGGHLSHVSSGRQAEFQGQFDAETSSSDLTFQTQFSQSAAELTAGPLQVMHDYIGSVAGTPEDWALQVTGRIGLVQDHNLDRAGSANDKDPASPTTQSIQAQVELLAQGTTTGMALEDLTLDTGAGALRAKGAITWTDPTAQSLTPDRDALHVDLKLEANAFNPGLWLADWPGQLDGSARLDLILEESDWSGTLSVPSLGGELRGYPLQAELELTRERSRQSSSGTRFGEIRGSLVSGSAELKIDGQLGDQIDLQLDLDAEQISDLLPGISGSARGQLNLNGPSKQPTWQLELDGNSLAWQDYSLTSVALQGHGQPQAWQGTLDTSGLQIGGLSADLWQFALNTQANQTRLEFSGDLADQQFVASTSLRIPDDLTNPITGGEIDQLQWQSAIGTWQLQNPAAWHFQDQTLSVDALCLTNESSEGVGPASLCGQGMLGEEHGEWTLAARAIPMATLAELVDVSGKLPGTISGTLDSDAKLERQASGWHYVVQAGSDQSAWQWRELDGLQDSEISQLEVNLEGDQQRLSLQASVQINQGSVVTELDLPLDGVSGSVEGLLRFNSVQLEPLEALWPRLVSAGTLDGQLSISGQAIDPALTGQLQLAGAAFEIPSWGISPSIERLSIEAQGQQLRVTLQGASGAGQMTGQGSVTVREQGLYGQLQLQGDALAVLRTAAARLDASPELNISFNGRHVHAAGSVVLPGGEVNLAKTRLARTPSPDVIKPSTLVAQPESRPWTASSDIVLQIEPPITLSAPGFGGAVSGELQVIKVPTQRAFGIGDINIAGDYQAYGQQLSLTRGDLRFRHSPLDNPLLDLRAEREVGTVSAGLQIGGTLRQPDARLWSNSGLSDAETLSYIVFGRPASQVSSANSGELALAVEAVALAQGNALAAPVASALGIDALEIQSNEGLKQATLLVGKYLTPGLYVAYGVGLASKLNVMQIRYEINRNWSLNAETGEDTRTSVRYRIERD